MTNETYNEETTNNLTLKRGSGKSFEGKNWQLAGDNSWDYHYLYIPNGMEKFFGLREIEKTQYAIFMCLDDTFFAQPVSICELPIPDDCMTVVYLVEKPIEVNLESKKPEKSVMKSHASSNIMEFSGKNWKLAGNSKWKKFSGFIQNLESSLGERKIGSHSYKIHRFGGVFLAIRIE